MNKKGRPRGIWTAYTPQNTPFKFQVEDGIVLPLPSLKALEKFTDEAKELYDFYQNGNKLFDDEALPLDYYGALMLIYERKFRKWLENQENN